MVIQQSKAKQLHGQMGLNNPTPVPCGGTAQQMEGMSKWSLIGFFLKTIIWHYFGYGIGWGVVPSVLSVCLLQFFSINTI
jgi:hypothetical protein